MSDVLDQGAAAELRWLSGKAAQAREEYDIAEAAFIEASSGKIPPALDGIDAKELIKEAGIRRDLAFNKWERMAAFLHKFDKSVPDAKRDTSEKISRAEGESIMERTAIYFRAAIETLVTQFCGDVLSCKEPADVHELMAQKIRDAFRGALDGAVREEHLPSWVKTSFESAL